MRVIEKGTKLYKKCWAYIDYNETMSVIVELEVTEPGICADWHRECDYEDSQGSVTYIREHDITNSLNKCRVREAKVLSIKDMKDNDVEVAHSGYDYAFTYTVGKVVRPRRPFEDGNWACASGIHGFETRELAENYDI